MPRIMAFVDGSTYADSVCDHAAWAASRMTAAVDVLHVLGRRDMSGTTDNFSGALDVNARDHLLEELASLDEKKAKLAQQRGRVILDHARERLATAGVAETTGMLRIGDLVETMQELESKADLIVIGKRGEAANFAKLHLGSNIERVVRASTKPILIAARVFKPIQRVAIAFDGGPSITKSIAYLAQSAATYSGLDLHVVTAGDANSAVARQLDEVVGTLKAAGYTVRASVLAGQPEQVIAGFVEREACDLLVMGAYGHSRIRNLIIGSTTTEMIRSCKVPIALFR